MVSYSRSNRWTTVALFPLLALLFLIPGVGLAYDGSDHWRFWNVEDGLGESYSSHVTEGLSEKVWVSHGHAQEFASCLDGYKVRRLPSPGSQIPIWETPGGHLWAQLTEFASTGRPSYTIGLQDYKFDEELELEVIQGQWKEHLISETGKADFKGQVLESKSGRILLACSDHLLAFNLAEGTTSTIMQAEQTGLTGFTRMIRAKNGEIWVGGISGVARLTLDESPLLAVIAWDEFLFDNDSKWTSFLPLRASSNGVAGTVKYKSAMEGSAYIEWNGVSWNELYGTVETPVAILKEDNETIWEISSNNILRIRDGIKETIQKDGPLSGTIHSSMLTDNDALWITTGSGLAKHSKHLWKRAPGFPKEDFNCQIISEDPQNRLWFAGQNSLLRLDGNGWQCFDLPEGVTHTIHSNSSLAFLPSGNVLWPTAFLVRSFDPQRRSFSVLSHEMNRTPLFFVMQTESGGAWVQTRVPGEAGVELRLEFYDGQQFNAQFKINQRVIAMTKAHNGDIYAISSKEVFRVVDKSIESIPLPKNIKSPFLRALLQCKNASLWLGDSTSIMAFDGHDWSVIRKGFDMVRSMTQTRDGSIWVATLGGLYRFAENAWIAYSPVEGLPVADFKTVYEDSQGRIWAGGVKGVYLYDPKADTDPPETYIGPKINPKEVAPGGEVQITFMGIDKWKYTPRDRLLYSHQFDGGLWSPFSIDTVATSAGLSAGRHTFEVRAMDRNKNIDPNPARFEFTVLLPWYQQSAFLWASAFSVLATLSAIAFALSRHLRLKHAYGDAIEAREAADTANRTKSEFLANMSHEIRTPMNAVLGMTEVVLQAQMDASQRSHLETIQTAGRSLLDVINDVLDISKIEAGKVYLENIDFDLHELTNQVIRNLAPLAMNKNIELSLSLASDVPQYLKGDPGNLRRILFNLLANAIKFTDEGFCVVHVSCAESPQSTKENIASTASILFEVRDTGIGIQADKHEAIFETFSQADASTTRKYGGTGLGLTIARKLAESMQGKMWVESELGQGSRFFFTAVFDRNVALPDHSSEMMESGEVTKPESDMPEGKPRTWNILVVEDNPENQTVATLFLVRMGHRVSLANNGREALEILAKDRFDAVLMDVQMPEMDGIEATRLIRAGTSGTLDPKIPIIAVTAHALKGDREHLMESGMTEYISKPIDSIELKMVLARVLTGRAVEFEAHQSHRASTHEVGKTSDSLGIIGDDPFLLPVLKVFAQRAAERLDAIKTAIQKKEVSSAGKSLHTLLGSSATIGAQRLVEALRCLQAIVKSQDWGEADRQISQVIEELDRVQASTEALIQQEDCNSK